MNADKNNRPVPKLCVVVPCYNEEDVLPLTAPCFIEKLRELESKGLAASESRVLFVDDGSTDATWSIIEDLHKDCAQYEGLKLSRNCGHKSALLAGLMQAKGCFDATISIDCDGQDDIDAMDRMLEAYLEGAEVVYGVRNSRDTDSFFKRHTAESFYRTLNFMGVESVFNHADYRLLSKVALDGLSEFKEVNLFLRGLVPLVGFHSETVGYERHERMAGESHYPIGKMIGLALDGITSLSVKPIRMISWGGALVSLISAIMIIWVVVMQATGNSVTGWASILAAVLLLGGIQLLALGVIGEYVGRIYLETKHRPKYLIEKCTLR